MEGVVDEEHRLGSNQVELNLSKRVHISTEEELTVPCIHCI